MCSFTYGRVKLNKTWLGAFLKAVDGSVFNDGVGIDATLVQILSLGNNLGFCGDRQSNREHEQQQTPALHVIVHKCTNYSTKGKQWVTKQFVS
jgi:hypothetical protein